MPVASADAALKKWQAAMSSGTARQNYIDGVNATTVNPMAEAATPQAMQRYLDGVTLSVTSGRRQNKLNSVPQAVWKNGCLQIGAARLAQAAQKGGPKYQAYAQRAAATWQAMQDAAKNAQGTLAKIQAALNVQLAAAGKPTI